MRVLVLEGGAMRGIFTAGVLDAFAERGEPRFDLVVGVSAGACCAASYLAGQHGRNRRVFLEHMTTRRFANPFRALRGGSLVDMAFLMGPVTLELDPLDLAALRRSPVELEVVATDAVRGEARYLPAQDEDCVDALHATVAMPAFYRGCPVVFRDRELVDGGVADPIPVARALERGASDLTVVLTRPASWRPRPLGRVAGALLALAMADYPGTVHAVRRRHEVYRRVREALASPPEGVALRVLRPPEELPVSRFTTDRAALETGYEMGRRAGADARSAPAQAPNPSRPSSGPSSS